MSGKPMCEERCSRCGNAWDDKHRLIICNDTHKLVCEWCHTLCEHYRRQMLPNGTHCYKSFEDEYYKYRLLSRPIFAPDSKVVAAVPKYEAERYTGKLFDRFRVEAHLYGNLDDEQLRAAKRVELAAMQRVLRQRIMAEPITRRMYERLNGNRKAGENSA